jgi:GNAT superfamily N-acetyltransferase
MNDNMTLTLRPISAGDIADVMRIQAQCYPVSMQEPEDVVLSRIEAAGHTSLVAHAGNAGVCAYVFAYPGKLGGVTKLNRAFALPVNPDTLYIHDLAVPPGAAGKGLARKLVAGLVDLARNGGWPTRRWSRCRTRTRSGSAWALPLLSRTARVRAKPWRLIRAAPAT